MSYERTVEQYENYIELLENREEYTDENDKNLYENILDFWVNNYDNEYQCDLYVYVDRIERDENKKITYRTECFENVGGNSYLDDDHFRFMKTGGTGHSTIIDEIPDFVIAFKETFPDKKVPDTNEYGDEMNESEQAEYIRLSYPEQFHSFENECLRESDTVREWINSLIDEEKEEMIYQLAETIRAEESVQFIENIRMFNARQNWVNAKPFPNKVGFEGLSSYKIVAECNGVVLGVTAKGDCAVWDGEYHANGELRGVSNGRYFTGAGYGDNPKDLFANAFACFNEMVERTQEKDYELVFYQYNDYEDFTTDKQYSSVYAARSAGEYQLVNGTCEGFAIYNQATKKFAYEGEFPIEKYFDADVLRLNGYSVDDDLDLTGQDEHRGR